MTFSTISRTAPLARFTRRAALALAAAPLLIGSAMAQQAAWPDKMVKLVVPFPAGGPTDTASRIVGQRLSERLGQPVVVENRPGAGGNIGTDAVAKAAPDGYTFLIHHNGMATAPGLYRKLAYNPLTDFEYVSQVVDVPMTLLARKDFPARTPQEMLAYVKQQGSKLTLAHAGLGAVSQLCGMLFQKMIDTEFTTVPYQGTAPALNALLGGQVDLLCDQTTQTVQHIRAGNVKFYGVTTRDRIKVLPDAPTLAEQGLKGFEVVVWHGIYAPKNTPKDATEKQHDELARERWERT